MMNKSYRPESRYVKNSNQMSTGMNTSMNTGMNTGMSTGMNTSMNTNTTDRNNNNSLISDQTNTKNNDNNKNGNFRENYQERFREVNRELIRYIYSTVDISKFKYELLKNKQQMSRFISNTHYISPNYNGKNCLLVFTKLKSKYYSFLVDRRQLSYSIDKVKLDEVFIHHCNVDVDLPIFQGTIFDGVYIRKGIQNGQNGHNGTFGAQYAQHEFIINDVYAFRGTDYTGNKLNLKLFEINLYLDNINSQIHAIRDRINAKTNLELKINNVANLLDIRKFVKNDMKIIDKDYQTKGLCFYPELSGTKLVFIMNDGNNNGNNNGSKGSNFEPFANTSTNTSTNTSATTTDLTSGSTNSFHKSGRNSDDSGNNSESNETKSVTKSIAKSITKSMTKSENTSSINNNNSNSNVINPNNNGNRGRSFVKSKALVKKTYVAKSSSKPIYAVLEMKGTNTVDNYKLFAVEQIKDGESIRLKKYQMDIAYIPDIEKSRWCKDIITSSHKGSVFVKCLWRDDKRKWEPLELKKDAKLPSLMEDIRKEIVEMELSDSDTDVE
jgi:hypothetical protein